jgi:predicted HTH domain antitoxin
MMPLVISDDVLRQAGMDEQAMLVEVACRLFDAGKLRFHVAMRMAGLDRIAFEDELRARNIAIYRPTVDDLRQDLETLRRMGS